MTVAILPRRVAAPLPPTPEDRWQEPGAARTGAAAIVLLASLLVHAAFVATALLPEAAPQAPTEIAVEVVQEPPKAEATPARVAEKPAVPPPQPAKSPPEPPPAPAKQPAPDAGAELKALRDELASLKAEHAALAARPPADKPSAGKPSAGASAPLRGLGPLPDSFQAAALPGEAGEGEVYGYAAIVFSQLAKAKEVGVRMGEPGSAGVSFAIDDRGNLASVTLAVSSGIKALDEEAVAIVRKAAPFPPPPEGAQRSFSANVNFVGAGR